MQSITPAYSPVTIRATQRDNPSNQSLETRLVSVRNTVRIEPGGITTTPRAHLSLASFITSENVATSSPQLQNLIGKTVDPHIANRTLDTVQYSGTGEIRGFKTARVERSTYQLLTESLITPLNVQAQKVADAVRTPATALMSIIAVMDQTDFVGKPHLMAELKTLFLGSQKTTAMLDHALKSFRTATQERESERYDRIEKIIASVSKEPLFTLAYDNLYGRNFDSALAQYVIEHPSSDMQHVAARLAAKIIADYDDHSDESKSRIATALAKYMQEDPQPWTANIKEVQRFLDDASPQNFKEMLHTSSAYSIPLINLLTIKYAIKSARAFSNLLARASTFYVDVIAPQRTATRVTNNLEHSTRTGINLAYQQISFGDPPQGTGRGVRPIDKYRNDSTHTSPHDQLAMADERATAIGMSGSSNILKAVFDALASNEPHFPMQEAHLMAAATLTFSGGHSINEAYSVFNYRAEAMFVPTPYSELCNAGDLHKAAIDHAYEATLALARQLNA